MIEDFLIYCDIKLQSVNMSDIKVITMCSQLTEILGPLPKLEDNVILSSLNNEEEEELYGDALKRAILRQRLEDNIKTPYLDSYVLPPSLLDQLTHDVLTIARDEPCGIRGCVLTVNLSAEATDSKREETLAQVKADITTPTTHELVVTLQADCSSWYTKMTKIFRSLSRRKIVISPKYELRKNKICNFEE